MMQGIIFDLFDTLIYIEPSILNTELDNMAAVAGVASKVFRENWAPKSAVHRIEYFKGRLALSDYFAVILKEMGKVPDPQIIQKLVEIRLAMREHVRYFEDTLPTLTKLREQGYNLGLISNLGSLWGKVIDTLALKSHFDAVTLSYEVALAKPEPEIYLYTAEKLGCKPESCMFIDDQFDYVTAATRVGMVGCWLNRNSREQPVRLSESKIEQVTSISAVLGFLEGAQAISL
ncbi:MAG: HAD family hydrolase [bacterium]|nr:HAD family hydrolase [bacterium]